MRIVLLGLAGLFILGGAPKLWSWVHSKNAPQEMSLEDYVKNGSDNDWVVLTGVYVDADNNVKTQLVKNGESSGRYAGTYYPLRTGPNDKRPVKVFLSPGSILMSSPQITLLDENDPNAGAHLEPVGPNDRQTLRGMRLRSIDFNADLERVLHSCNLATANELVLIKQGSKPISRGGAFGMMGAVAGSLILFGLTFLFRRKSRA